jgi:hypothetical protein
MKLSAFFHSNWCERSDTTCMRYSWMTGRALLKTKMSGVWNAAPLLRGCLIFRGLANQFPAFAITVIYQYLTGYERSLWVAELHDHLCLMFYPASKNTIFNCFLQVHSCKMRHNRLRSQPHPESHSVTGAILLVCAGLFRKGFCSSEQGYSSWKQNGEQGRLGNSVLTHPWLSSCVAPAGLAARL